MALFKDEVVLTLAGEALRITESYEIRAGVFEQPAGFAVRLGHGGVLAELLRKYPPNTPFSLAVNGNTVQTGFTDGKASGEGSGATEVTFKGRDIMAPVTKAYVAAERAFQGITYAELTEQVLELCGLVGYTRASGKLVASNEANRRRIAGKQIVQTAPPQVDVVDFSIDDSQEILNTRAGAAGLAGDTEVTLFRNAVPGTTKAVYKTLKITIGTKWYDGFLKVQLDRGGLFLWASGDGGFVLSTPNPEQEPSFEITRPRRGERGVGNVLRHSFDATVTNRYSKWIVYGRGGGRNFGRTKAFGQYIDREIAEIFGSEDACINTHQDNSCDTLKKCQHLARRRASEANRDAWSLSYTVSGHSTAGRRGRGVWAQDTIVSVDDRELGISGNFYLESLTMNRAPATTTTIRLMRPQDLLFGELGDQ